MHFDIERLAEHVRPLTARELEQLHADLSAVAHPRFTGSPGAVDVGAELRTRFSELGYQILELPFSFSSWPGRFGLPVAGAAALLAFVGSLLLLRAEVPLAALTVLVIGGLLVAALALFSGRMIQRLRWGRMESANWLIYPAEARPRYLVMAHRDTKSQPIPMLVRTGAVVLALLSWLGLAALAGAAIALPDLAASTWTAWLALLGVVGSATLMAGWVGNESPGALDNGSGLAVALTLARRERGAADVAFLLTDAEELGLAGARAVIPHLPRVFAILNLDGLDDQGTFRIVERHGWPRRKGLAPDLAAALLTASDALGLKAERAAVPPGVLVDHMPLVDAGFPAITLMRGTWGSLARVHRPGDDLKHLSAYGVAESVALVSGALNLLRLPPPVQEKVLPGSLGTR